MTIFKFLESLFFENKIIIKSLDKKYLLYYCIIFKYYKISSKSEFKPLITNECDYAKYLPLNLNKKNL